jgi:hypothetical protein
MADISVHTDILCTSRFVINTGSLFLKKSSFLLFRNFDDDGFIQLHYRDTVMQSGINVTEKKFCIYLQGPYEVSAPITER